ncbi:serine/threonine protein kinase [Tengunoibacter tsumagoiensis]|uniref:Protein kinase domain-containing protein n=1 Tax=Tengunoibacter tsumagoiensis TaxID=2014871 RepID=A0A402A5X4_9CHLR|nr:serine/threonine-protein kinase [Tengunoibacter tsumagoiensis]GCE14436.1 hypothetical protein KTT_42950 [Tengunoibacter tsumagoiensis]
MNDHPLHSYIGNYRLLHLLGKSDFSAVYLGEQIDDQTQVAIKIVPGATDEQEVEKFLAQVSTFMQLQHPYIMPIRECGLDEQGAFLVMDYAAGGNLRQRHPRGDRVQLEIILSYVKQLTAALQFIHDEGFVHRDIKPHNMLLSANGTVLLSDFGAAVTSVTLDPSHTYDFEGTVLYTAPEQLHGRPRRRTDQYALAVVIYEWLSGERLFTGTFHEIAHQHLFITPPSFQERGIPYPANIEQVIQRALQKDPDKRFASVKLFAEELEWSYKVAQARGTLPAPSEKPQESPPSIEHSPAQKGQFRSPLAFRKESRS